MKHTHDFFTFIYRTIIDDTGILCLPGAWKAIAAGVSFSISDPAPDCYLFTPSMDGHTREIHVACTEENPAEDTIPKDLFFVDEDGCFEEGLGCGMQNGNWFWVGLGDEFLLLRSDIPAFVEKNNGTFERSPARPERAALRRLLHPNGSYGKTIYEAARDLRKIRCQYNLFAIALTHPDSSMAGLAAAAIQNRYLLRKLTELTILDPEKQSLGVYTALRLGSRELFHLKATWFSEILQVMAESDLPPIEEPFRLRRITVLHGPGYRRNCMSDCRYEDRALRKLQRITDPIQIFSYAAKEPYVDVYRECLRKLSERKDLLFWAALFWHYDLDRSFAVMCIRDSSLKTVLKMNRDTKHLI